MGKIFSLKKVELFKKLLREGRKYRDSLFKLYILPQEEKKVMLGVSLPRKIKGSVVRNKIKRRLKEIVRKTTDGIENGYSILIIPEEKIKEASFQDISSKIEKIFRSLK
jgi:ribonuclease P protein component